MVKKSSRMMFVIFYALLLWTSSGSTSKTNMNIKCVIINLEYVNCSWDEDRIPKENFTFISRYESEPDEECSRYVKVEDINVACMVPFEEMMMRRFQTLHARLYSSNGSVVAKHDRRLTDTVKLDPPYNLTLELVDPELWLYWKSNNRTKPICKESQVRFRINGKDWQAPQAENAEKNSFSVPFPNARSLYEFQVRVRMSSTCGQSELWSDWSEMKCWGSMKDTNDTETRAGSSTALMVLYTVGAAVLLIIMSCLLVHRERLRIILIPVVPNPGKNFTDLIDNYDGNVEKWLCISKELQDGFKPNFTERTCPVQEYKLLPQSSSDSESSMSSLTDVSSDYQPMNSYTTDSTQASPTSPSIL